MKNNMYLFMLCSAFAFGMDAPVGNSIANGAVSSKENHSAIVICRVIEIDPKEKAELKKYKKKQSNLRFLAALPYYSSTLACTLAAETESDSESIFFDTSLNKSDRAQKVISRAKEKYSKDLEKAKKRVGHQLTGMMDAEIRRIPLAQRDELKDEIIKQHWFRNQAIDDGYAGDNESAIWQTITKFSARKNYSSFAPNVEIDFDLNSENDTPVSEDDRFEDLEYALKQIQASSALFKN